MPFEVDHVALERFRDQRVIEVAKVDISPSTVIHIPSIDTVIGGDVVYNRIHMMLALTGPAEWQKWIDSIDLVESLGATTIIAGHKQPDDCDEDLTTILDGSRGYIREFRDAVGASTIAGEVIDTMTAKYPDYGNLTTLVFSASAAFAAAHIASPIGRPTHDPRLRTLVVKDDISDIDAKLFTCSRERGCR